MTEADAGAGLRLRPATAEDEAFLLAVYASTREQEMAMVPWSAEQREAFLRMQFAAQSSYYRERYPEGEHSIVEADGQPVGRVYVARLADELHVLDITILPVHRNRGIGSRLLGDLLKQAAAAGLPARIYVENFNPSQSLFARLGFRKVGEQGIHDLLEWHADA